MKQIIHFFITAWLLTLSSLPALSADIDFDLTTAKISLNQKGRVTSILLPDGSNSPASGESSFQLNLSTGENLTPNSLKRDGNKQ